MWLVFVDTFDGTDPQAWADQTFTATSLGVDDYLLAVAMGDRQYGYVVDQGFALDDAALARVATAAERHLAENPARAVTTAASTIGTELTGATTSPGGPDSTVPGWVPAAVLGGFAVFLLARCRSSAARAALRSPERAPDAPRDGIRRTPIRRHLVRPHTAPGCRSVTSSHARTMAAGRANPGVPIGHRHPRLRA
jgi:hypothetical protein